MSTLCSCGELTPHAIARRETADGVLIKVWSDGALTCRLGLLVPGLGALRSAHTQARRARAVHLMLDEISLFDLEELPRLIRLAENSFRYEYKNEDFRRRDVLARF